MTVETDDQSEKYLRRKNSATGLGVYNRLGSNAMSYPNNLQATGQVVTKSAKQMIDALFSTSASTKLGLVGISLIVLIMIKLISLYLTNSSYKSSTTTKAQRSHAMKQEFGLIERNESLQKSNKVSPSNIAQFVVGLRILTWIF